MNNWRKILSWQQVMFDPDLTTTFDQYIQALTNGARAKGVLDKPGYTVEKAVQQYVADVNDSIDDGGVSFEDLFSIARKGLQIFYENDLEHFIYLYNDGNFDDRGLEI